jgi:hypothetical protein
MRGTAILTLLVTVLPLCAAAQSITPPADRPLNISPAFGVHFGTPLRSSLAVGVLIDMNEKVNDGVVAMIEPGQHGNEISAGYFRMLGHLGSGYSLRAAVLRTGDEPWNASPHTTYVGVEAHWMLIFGVGGRMGYLRRASRTGNDPHDNLASIGVSIGG